METLEKSFTKREALEITIKMWEYLAEHPEANKRSTAISVLELPEMRSNCALCHYDGQFEDDCSNCLIWNDVIPCTEKGQAFYNWRHAESHKDKILAADWIATVAREKLSELDQEESQPKTLHR